MRCRWLLLFLFTLPLLADTPVSSARFFSPTGEIGQAAETVDGLVVWETLVSYPLFHIFDYRFFARTIGANGMPSLPSRIRLPLPNASRVPPAIGSNGHGYLVVAGALGAANGVRLDATGNILDPAGISIHPVTRFPFEPGETGYTFHDVAWDGANWIVTSTRQDSFVAPAAASAIASIVTADGQIAQQEIAVTDRAPTALVAARNGVTLFAWSTPSGIEARTMFGSVTTVAPPAQAFDVAANDDGFVIVWTDGSAVRAQQLDPSGRTSGFPSTIPNEHTAGPITIVPRDFGYDVFWFNGSEIVQAQVRGGMITSHRFASDATASVSLAGDTPVAAWVDAQHRALLRRLDATTDPSVLDVAATKQWSGNIIFDGSQYFAAWTEESINPKPDDATPAAPFTALTGRITSSGEHPDGSGKILSENGSVAIFRGSDTHLLLWSDGPSIHATLIAHDGRIVGTNDDLPAGSFAIWNGSSFLVTWRMKDQIYGMRLAANGTLLDSAPRLVLDYPAAPSGVFANGKYVFATGVGGSALVFVVNTEFALNNVTVLLQRPFAGIATDGSRCLVAVRTGGLSVQLLDEEGNASGPLTGIANDVPYPSTLDMVWDGQTYNIAWTSRSNLMLSRVTANGELIDTEKISTTVDNTAAPFVSIAPGALMYAKVGATDEYKNVRRLFFEPVPPLWRRRASGTW